MTGLIGVAIPTWRGHAFIGETIASVLAQDGVDLRVFISVDGEDEGLVALCRSWDDSRLQVIIQPERLGWVRNTAAALEAAADSGADFVCVQPHDDLMAPNYLRALLDTVEAGPDAAVVYGDIQCFGDMTGRFQQPSVCGTAIDRQVDLIARHFSAVAYRGLMRSATWRVSPLTGNDCGDFACDTLWMARLALQGDLVRAPEALYFKRYHPQNTHFGWLRFTSEEQIEAWLQHCLDMTEIAISVCQGADDLSRVMQAAAHRVHRNLSPLPALKALDTVARDALAERFEQGCMLRFGIERAPPQA